MTARPVAYEVALIASALNRPLEICASRPSKASARRSRRSSGALSSIAAAWAGLELRTIPVERGLHLKSAVTAIDDHTIVLDRAALDPGHFAGLEVIEAGEPPGGNVLALGERLLVSAAAPRTIAALRGRAPLTRPLIVLELAEIHRADGALTCLSLRVPPPGCWCA